MDDNPEIDLYHVSPYEGIDYIFEEGIYPIDELIKSKISEKFRDKYKGKTIDEILESDPLHRVKKKLYEKIPEHKHSVFLWKNEPHIIYEMGGLPITVHADKIPCRCSEGNSEAMEKLFKKYAQSLSISYKVPEEKLQKLEKEYKDSIRLLDDKKNEYRTEVMCPCHIPVDAIEVPKLFKQLQLKREKITFNQVE